MHESSYRSMEIFRDEFLSKDPGKVLEVGSRDINGSYRPIFEGADYTGLDAVGGPCVDYVPADPYDWKELASDSFDVVISGQTLEHIEFPDRTMAEIKRVLKPSGRVCIIVPSDGRKHEQPDYRRYKHKDLHDLVVQSGFEIIKMWHGEAAPWFDVVAVFEKKGEKVSVQESCEEIEKDTAAEESIQEAPEQRATVRRKRNAET